MLTDQQVLALVQQQATYSNGELSKERADALDYYLGQPYGDEVEGRSRIVTREVMETVEWILPSLVRIFCDSDNLVVFEPVGEEDEAQAEQETDVCNHVFWKVNKGFYNVYTFLKDALLSKTGILKCWWEDDESEEREEYDNLDDVGLMSLFEDTSVEREVLEAEANEDGTLHVVFRTKRKKGRVRIEPIPPEEFKIAKGANSPYAKDARHCRHTSKKTKSELIEAGYDRKLVESLPTSDGDFGTEEALARRHLSDEQNIEMPSNDEYWVTEAYSYIDRDEDGIAELLKVTYVSSETGDGSATLLDIEEVDRIPFATVSPVILTHKFYGLSIADLTMDLQRIKSTLLRQILDNAYLANNGRTVINDEYVNLDDLLTSRPGGVVRLKGDQPVGHYLTPLPHNPIPTESFGLLEYLDECRKQRTGVADEVAALDKTALSNVNTGVMALAYDAARSKIELIARIIAEIGFTPLFRDIHELLSKHQDREMVVKLRNKWTRVRPQEWRERENITVKVGVGQVSRERRIMALEGILAKQTEIAAGGGIGSLVMPSQLYMGLKQWVQAWGMEPELYFTDPATLPPPPPQPPGPEQMVAEAALVDAQSKMARAENERLKVEADARYRAAELSLKLREQQVQGQMEALKHEIAALKLQNEADGKVASMSVEQQRRAFESELKVLEMRQEAINQERDRLMEKYKAELDASVEVLKLSVDSAKQERQLQADREMAKPEKPEKKEPDQLAEILARIQQRLDEEDAEKPITRDANGLIIAIGKRKVKRDEKGQAISIG